MISWHALLGQNAAEQAVRTAIVARMHTAWL